MANNINLRWLPLAQQRKAARLIVETCTKLALLCPTERKLDEALAKLPVIARRQKARAQQRRGR